MALSASPGSFPPFILHKVFSIINLLIFNSILVSAYQRTYANTKCFFKFLIKSLTNLSVRVVKLK